MTRFDLLGKYASFPNTTPENGPAPACESLGFFLISPDLKAVMESHASPSCIYKGENSPRMTGDESYMLYLAVFFENHWGRRTDDVGSLVFMLDHFLKR